MLQDNHPLYYLIKINDYQSISLAAENLHISQPALSQAIKNLEKNLNLTLLNRTYRGVNLTEDGKKVVELAEKAFSYFEEIENLASSRARQNENSLLNDLTVYVNPAYQRLILSSYLDEYKKQENQSGALQLQNLTAEDNINELIKNNPSVVVLGLLDERKTLADNLAMTVLNKSKCYVMYTKDFSYFPPEKTSVSFQELVSVPLIISKTHLDFQNTLFNILKLHGEPNIKAVAPDYLACSYMVESGIGYCFTNKLSLNGFADKRNLRYLNVRKAPKFCLVLVYSKKADQAKINKLAELIKSCL